MTTPSQELWRVTPRVQARLTGRILLLCCAGAVRAAIPDASALGNPLANPENPHLPALMAESSNLAPEVSDVDQVFNELQKMSRQPRVDRPVSPGRFGLVLPVVLAIGGTLLIRRFLPVLVERLAERGDRWTGSAGAMAGFSEFIRKEDKAVSDFAAAFHSGPSVMSGNSEARAASAPGRDPLKEFFTEAPRLLGKLRKLLQTIGRAPDPAAQRSCLAALNRELQELKGKVGLSELLPVWQMAAAVEGLVKQLANKPANVTSSALRTVAGGVDALKALCVPGLRPDLLKNPPIRLLAVDDDLVSRTAVSLALKRAFNSPDVAVDGASALALVEKQAYDVIFLDVEMPGMDGFELCTRIHDTAANRTTPMVFVTCHGDFKSRTQAALRGGSDLLAKPFLTFEITVKALTLAVQGRLPGSDQSAHSRRKMNHSKPPLPEIAQDVPRPRQLAADGVEAAARCPGAATVPV